MNERWEGETEARVENLEKQMDAVWAEITPLRLAFERSKGWAEGSKATLLFIGTLIGAALGGIVSWLVKKF